MGLTKNLGWLSKYITADSSGKIGIGTTPAEMLDVNGSIKLANGYNITWGGSYGANIPTIYATAGSNSSINFAQAGSTRTPGFCIINNGNVGVGNTSPYTLLDVNGSIGIANVSANTDAGSDPRKAGIGWKANGADVVLSTLITTNNVGDWGGDLLFYTRPASSGPIPERMRIFSNGNVGINTGATDAGYKLDVNGTGRFSSDLTVSTRISLPGMTMGYWDAANNRIESGSRPLLITSYAQPINMGINGGTQFTINTSGNIGISTQPRTKFHNNGSFLTQLNWYGEAKSFYFQCAFNNPTIDLFTSNSTTSYGAVIIKVTIYHNTVSTGMCSISTGYANWAGNPLPTISRGIIAPVIQASFNGAANVGTLYWDFNTLKFTANRITNYDGYSIVVEWGANGDYNQFPTYGANLP